MINSIASIYQPNSIVIYGKNGNKDISAVMPFIIRYPPAVDGSPLVYVCQNYSCKLPTSDINTVRKLLTEN